MDFEVKSNLTFQPYAHNVLIGLKNIAMGDELWRFVLRNHVLMLWEELCSSY